MMGHYIIIELDGIKESAPEYFDIKD